MVQYAKKESGGSLEGKKIALVYHDSAYGKEPIATLERLAPHVVRTPTTPLVSSRTGEGVWVGDGGSRV